MTPGQPDIQSQWYRTLHVCKWVCVPAHVSRHIVRFAAVVCQSNDREDGISLFWFFFLISTYLCKTPQIFNLVNNNDNS